MKATPGMRVTAGVKMKQLTMMKGIEIGRTPTAMMVTGYPRATFATTTATARAVRMRCLARTVWESRRSTWAVSPWNSTWNTTEENTEWWQSTCLRVQVKFLGVQFLVSSDVFFMVIVLGKEPAYSPFYWPQNSTIKLTNTILSDIRVSFCLFKGLINGFRSNYPVFKSKLTWSYEKTLAILLTGVRTADRMYLYTVHWTASEQMQWQLESLRYTRIVCLTQYPFCNHK